MKNNNLILLGLLLGGSIFINSGHVTPLKMALGYGAVLIWVGYMLTKTFSWRAYAYLVKARTGTQKPLHRTSKSAWFGPSKSKQFIAPINRTGVLTLCIFIALECLNLLFLSDPLVIAIGIVEISLLRAIMQSTTDPPLK